MQAPMIKKFRKVVFWDPLYTSTISRLNMIQTFINIRVYLPTTWSVSIPPTPPLFLAGIYFKHENGIIRFFLPKTWQSSMYRVSKKLPFWNFWSWVLAWLPSVQLLTMAGESWEIIWGATFQDTNTLFCHIEELYRKDPCKHQWSKNSER